MKQLLLATAALLVMPAYAEELSIPCDDSGYIEDVTRVLDEMPAMVKFSVHAVEVYNTSVDAVRTRADKHQVCHASVDLSNTSTMNITYWLAPRHGDDGFNVHVRVGEFIHNK